MELIDLIDKSKKPYFICIGSMKSCLDSVAPRIGTELKKRGYKVIGSIRKPIHARNIKERLENEINNIDKTKYQLIAIDAMFCDITRNNLVIQSRGILPGGFLSRNIEAIGELAVGLNVSKTFNTTTSFRMALTERKGYEHIINPLIKECVDYIINTYERVDNNEKVI